MISVWVFVDVCISMYAHVYLDAVFFLNGDGTSVD